jgi:hypothetical protein
MQTLCIKDVVPSGAREELAVVVFMLKPFIVVNYILSKYWELLPCSYNFGSLLKEFQRSFICPESLRHRLLLC